MEWHVALLEAVSSCFSHVIDGLVCQKVSIRHFMGRGGVSLNLKREREFEPSSQEL